MKLINEMSQTVENKLISDVCFHLSLQARARNTVKINFNRAIQIYKEADAIKADNDFWRSEWTTIFFTALAKAKELKITDWETQWEVVRNALVSVETEETATIVTEKPTQDITVQETEINETITLEKLATMDSFRGKTRQDIFNVLNTVVNKNKQTYEIINLAFQGCNYKSISKNLGIPDGTTIAVLNRLSKELGLHQGCHGGDVNGIMDYLLFYTTKKTE
jgi:hypothetical protein